MSSVKITEADLDNACKTFNKTIQELFEIYYKYALESKFRTKSQLDTQKTQLNIAIKANPLEPVETAMPILMEYKDQIKNGDKSFFLNKQYAIDVKKITMRKIVINGSEIPMDYEKSMNFISFILETYKNADTELQNKLVEMTQILLSNCAVVMLYKKTH